MSSRTWSAVLAVLIVVCSAIRISATTSNATFGVSVVVLPFCQTAVSKDLPSVSLGPASTARIVIHVVCNDPSLGNIEPNVAIEDQPALAPQIMVVRIAAQPSNPALDLDVLANDALEKRVVATHIPTVSGHSFYSHDWLWQISSVAEDIAFERITITY